MKKRQTEKKMDFDTYEIAKKKGERQKAGAGSGRRKKKRYIVPVFLFIFLIVLTLAVFGYYRVAVYYQTHFFPNTSINGVDCSDLEADAVINLLDVRMQDYTLEV